MSAAFSRLRLALTCLLIMACRLQAGEQYAFLVGVSGYDEKELRPLAYPRNDILALRDVLARAGYRPENMVVMVDALDNSPTKGPVGRFLPDGARIRKELTLLLGSLSPEDSLLIAFAGHGVQFLNEQESYFCPLDAVLDDRSSLISLAWLYEQLKYDPQTGLGCRARQRLLLVDACRNDPASSIRRSTGGIKLESASLPQLVPPPEGVVALFSCAEGQQALEHEPLKHGVFFYHVLEAFRGNADADGDRLLTLDELIAFTKSKTQTYARVNLGSLQTPRQKGFYDGTWTLMAVERFSSATGPEIVLSEDEVNRRKERARAVAARVASEALPPREQLTELVDALHKRAWVWMRVGDSPRALELIAQARSAAVDYPSLMAIETRARLLGAVQRLDPKADVSPHIRQLQLDAANRAENLVAGIFPLQERDSERAVEIGRQSREWTLRGLTEPVPQSEHLSGDQLQKLLDQKVAAEQVANWRLLAVSDALVTHPFGFASQPFVVPQAARLTADSQTGIIVDAYEGKSARVRQRLPTISLTESLWTAPYWVVPFAARGEWAELSDILSAAGNDAVNGPARILAAEIGVRIAPERLTALLRDALRSTARWHPDSGLRLVQGQVIPWSIDVVDASHSVGLTPEDAMKWIWRLMGKAGGDGRVIQDVGLDERQAPIEFAIGLLEDVPLP
jgi:hypothetical protein